MPASTVQEAIQALQHYGDSARLYAGGTELLVVLKQKVAHFDYLIDVKTIPGLNSIALEGSVLQVGALCPHAALERSPLVREHLPFLTEVENEVANVRVRNVGTVGGNLCFAEPHSDLGVVAVLLNAVLQVEGPAGKRSVAAADFTTGAYTTVLEPGEILTRIDFPLPPAGTTHSYLRFRFHERPAVAVGAMLSPAADGQTLAGARIGVGCAGPVPVRVAAAEALLAGRNAAEILAPGAGLAEQAGEAAAAAVETHGDFSGSAEYKSHLIRVYVARAVRTAAARLLGREDHV